MKGGAKTKDLETKCRALESRCSGYARQLKRINSELEKEFEKNAAVRERLVESHACFRVFFHNAPFGAVVVDKNGGIVSANAAIERMLDYSRDELTGMTLSGLSHPEDVKKDAVLFQRVVRGNQAGYTVEKRFLGKNRDVVWAVLAVASVGDPNARPTMAVATLEDVTARKNLRATADKARSELERLVGEHASEIQRLKERLQAENLFLRQEISESRMYGEIIGESRAIRTVVSQIELVAPTDANVLIQGESGAGKELVAREIHKRGRRKDRSLIKVNCAAIPRELYESEFFGHARGAFTGALHDRVGRFEAADGGTLFLDEVGEIPLELQSKMLRVLQDGEFERVGEGRTRKADVRIIAATNKDLKKEVEAKRFRDDLFYRLNVFPFRIAPLRERKGDIPLLAAAFVEKLSKKLNLPAPALTVANIQDLQDYDWPGNVRELENVVERALILSRSGKLSFNTISETMPPAGGEPPYIRTKTIESRQEAVLTENDIKRIQRQNTINALKRCEWKIYGRDGASRMLGLKPTTLIERMKRMKIRRPD